MSGRIYRQGDLLFREVNKIPGGFADSRNPVILEGEATGHKHKLVGGVVFRASYHREMYIRVENGGRIVHEEHATLVLPSGIYQVIRQREYSPYRNVNVTD
jgi:hypothetical protein